MTSPRLWRGIAVGYLLLVLAIQAAAISTENINWDEFGLLDRAVRTLATGQLKGDGRPGLAVVALLPFADGCDDPIAALRKARWLWFAIHVGLLAGIGWLVRRALSTHPFGEAAAWASVALVVSVPIYLRWSLHVRTDQLALAAAVWGGVALVASRRRPAWALAGGALLALGYLASQKAVYAVALVALLVAGEQAFARDWRWRRELGRALALLVGCAIALVAFDALVRLRFAPARALDVDDALDVFDYYRSTLGTRVYWGMLPTLLPQAALGLLATGILIRNRSRLDRGAVVLALAVAALGVAVAVFHAGATPYFWITLGLFPAIAISILGAEAAAKLQNPRARAGCATVVALLAAAVALPAAAALLEDTQAIQVESLRFVRDNFAPTDSGFAAEKALTCRPAKDPFRFFVSSQIELYFSGPARKERIASFLASFRELPVRFIVTSYRQSQFPDPILAFMRDNFAPYRAAVALPAKSFRLDPAASRDFEIVVAGAYAWIPESWSPTRSIAIDGQPLDRLERVELTVGRHRAASVDGRVAGSLVYAAIEPPSPSTQPFYSEAAIRELRGKRE